MNDPNAMALAFRVSIDHSKHLLKGQVMFFSHRVPIFVYICSLSILKSCFFILFPCICSILFMVCFSGFLWFFQSGTPRPRVAFADLEGQGDKGRLWGHGGTAEHVGMPCPRFIQFYPDPSRSALVTGLEQDLKIATPLLIVSKARWTLLHSIRSTERILTYRWSSSWRFALGDLHPNRF